MTAKTMPPVSQSDKEHPVNTATDWQRVGATIRTMREMRGMTQARLAMNRYRETFVAFLLFTTGCAVVATIASAALGLRWATAIAGCIALATLAGAVLLGLEL